MYELNSYFMEELKKRIGIDYNRLSRMSIVEEGAVKVLLNPSQFSILMKFLFVGFQTFLLIVWVVLSKNVANLLLSYDRVFVWRTCQFFVPIL